MKGRARNGCKVNIKKAEGEPNRAEPSRTASLSLSLSLSRTTQSHSHLLSELSAQRCAERTQPSLIGLPDTESSMDSRTQNRRSRRRRHRHREMMDLQRQEHHGALGRRQQQQQQDVPSSYLRSSVLFATMASLLWTPQEIAPWDIFLIAVFFSVPLSHLVMALGELTECAFVFLCFYLSLRLYSQISTTPSASERILREFREVTNYARQSVRISLDNGNLFRWQAKIYVPSGQEFWAHIDFPHNYPNAPPQVTFDEGDPHPNIDENGQIYLRILMWWNQSTAMLTVFNAICALLDVEGNHGG